MNSSLKALAQRIDRLGMVTAPFGSFLSVRLPLFCHIRVSIVNGRLKCEPYTGMVPRTRGTLLIFLIFGTVLWTTFVRQGVTAESISMGFFAALALALETLRYVVSESCITRVQALVLAEPWLLDEAAIPSSGTAEVLGVGTAPMSDVRMPERERAH